MCYKNILIIGGSRGLGRSLVSHLHLHLTEIETLTMISRKPPSPTSESLAGFTVSLKNHDMSRSTDCEEVSNLISAKKFDLIVYVAGGGPHGEFSSKEWKDHAWALQVGLISPMRLVWSWLNSRDKNKDGRFVIVGSRIAGLGPDPKASSYAASKHGLMGFVSSIQEELTGNKNQVWLFSPGYMDTEMLPRTARVRHNGTKILSIDTAAQILLRWVKKDGPWHRVI